LIAAGSCRVESACLQGPAELSAGDLIVFPRGGIHMLRHMQPDSPESEARCSKVATLCGEFGFNGGGKNPILEALPDCFVVRELDGTTHFRALGLMLSAELRRPMFGNQLVLNKLADSLLVLAIRSHFVIDMSRHGLLAGLNDPRLVPALAAIHALWGDFRANP